MPVFDTRVGSVFPEAYDLPRDDRLRDRVDRAHHRRLSLMGSVFRAGDDDDELCAFALMLCAGPLSLAWHARRSVDRGEESPRGRKLILLHGFRVRGFVAERYSGW